MKKKTHELYKKRKNGKSKIQQPFCAEFIFLLLFVRNIQNAECEFSEPTEQRGRPVPAKDVQRRFVFETTCPVSVHK